MLAPVLCDWLALVTSCGSFPTNDKGAMTNLILSHSAGLYMKKNSRASLR
jgi:hypothetical protein